MDWPGSCFTAVVLFFASIVAQSFGELVVLRQPATPDGSSRNLTCVSENDDSALIWNYDYRADKDFKKTTIVTDFQPKKLAANTEPRCAVWKAGICIAYWENQKGWNLVNSADRPIGPVTDYRWEGFKEFISQKSSDEQNYQYVAKVHEPFRSLAFSARGRDIDILLCESENQTEGTCLRIIIGSREGKQSSIWTCDYGAAQNRDPAKGSCSNVNTGWEESLFIDLYKWRTFRIEWMNEIEMIGLFNNSDVKPFLQGTVSQKLPGSHVSVRSGISSHVKFHFYDYFLTEKNGETLSTTKFHHTGERFCIELLVSLCLTCRLKIYLTNPDGQVVGAPDLIDGTTSPRDGSLSWQSMKRIRYIQGFMPGSLGLKIEAFANDNKENSQWAVDHFRVCEAPGEIRESTITIHRDILSQTPMWPQVYCQKISYKNSAIVNSLSRGLIYDDTQSIQQLIDSLASSCEISCPSLNDRSSICISTGCACNRGFKGSDCADRCATHTYGYDCNMACGMCHEGYCDKIDGHCHKNKCANEKLLPPLCKELGAPKITFITDTTARVLLNLKPEAVTSIKSIDFEVKELVSPYTAVYLSKLEKSSMYVRDIRRLKPNTTYTVKAVAEITGSNERVESPEISFTTNSLGARCFKVVPQKESLMVDLQQDLQECGALPSGVYTIELRDASKGYYNWRSTSSIFPVIFDKLKPYTKYNLTAYSNDETVSLTIEVRTHQSAPGQVRNLFWSYVAQTEVTLQWGIPTVENGIINKYSVTVEKIKPLGCDKEIPSPQEKMEKKVTDTTASFTGLDPYAKYKAVVIAYTTEPGPQKSITFNTEEAHIPTSAISSLELVENQSRLEWKKPEDCTTISGPFRSVKLFFAGLSLWAQDWTTVRITAFEFYNLKPLHLVAYTKYRVRVYVARSNGIVNTTCYQEKIWMTPPAAPPSVMSLQVYEADPDSNTISLRWIPPYPAHGEIESYHVSINGGGKLFKDYSIKVSEGIRLCELHSNYICLENCNLPPNDTSEVTVEVYVKNKGISERGGSMFLTNGPAFYYNRDPGDPENFQAIHQSQGVVTLTWMHPPFSSTRIKRFRIVVERLRTYLLEKPDTFYPMKVNYTFKQEQKVYSTMLRLEPSTDYKFWIVAISGRNVISKGQTIAACSTPGSLGFVNETESRVKLDGTVKEIIVPRVVNATQNTTIEIIVKGTSLCKPNQPQKSSSLSNPTKYVEKWVAAMYQVKNTPREPLRIGPDEYRGVTLTCYLDRKETYTIAFVVTDWYSGESVELEAISLESEPKKSNLTWLIILPIVAICLLVIFAAHRVYKKIPLKRSQQNILQLAPTAIDRGESTAPSTLKRPTPPPHRTVNRVSISQPSPDVVPSYNPISYPVKVEKFEEYVQEALASGLLDSQYEMFPKGLTKPCKYATLPENAPKNRYRDRVPYDETRVVLEKISRDPHSDYINASYIQGYRKKKAYIATQGPKPKTIDDFWRMIWQEKVQVICMLANVIEGGKKKCEQYWPEVGTELKYGNILVSHTKHQVFADYTIRTFTLVCRKETREVTHLHYTGWPDHGVPMYTQSLVAYLKKLLATSTGSGPVVVHCSAGVGRTGTIILCDICLRRAVAERIIDVPGALVKMRQERATMVDNAQQYLLVHLAIVESMVVEQTQLNCNSSLIQKIMELRNQLPSDVQRLNDTVWQDRALHSLGKLGHEEDVATNLVAPASPTTPTVKSQNNSLNAVDVVGVKMKNQFLATRLPSISTLSDFWILVKDRSIELVVVLQLPSPKDRNFCKIVPGDSTLDPTPNIQVERKMIPEVTDHFTIDKLLLTDSSTQAASQLPVTVITCTGWSPGKQGKPPTAAALVSLWMASEKIPRKEGQTLVLCHDGVTGCGLYLALSFLLERMAVERECDVISAVRAVRRSRTEFVQSLDQFEYLYDAAVNYAKCFEIYSNFS